MREFATGKKNKVSCTPKLQLSCCFTTDNVEIYLQPPAVTITSVGRHRATKHSYSNPTCKAPACISKEEQPAHARSAALMYLLLQQARALGFSMSKAREQWLSLKILALHNR